MVINVLVLLEEVQRGHISENVQTPVIFSYEN